MEPRRISHYEIVRLLGRGGMGEVYEAVDLDLERRPVALKFIAPEMAADAESLRRFEREAVSAAKLKHAHIATVHAFVREGTRPFIDMELVRGATLRERMSHGPMPPAEAAHVIRDVAAAVAHAHQRAIIHRDLKPENLMFDEDGSIKVMDFGLARAAQASALTRTGSTMGTAGYMAPESLRGSPGAPADVFALGVVLYEMLCGTLPFAGDSTLALMYTIANEPHTPLRTRQPDVPEALEALVDRMLAKDPEQRPDAATVARELSAFAGLSMPRFDPVTGNRPAVSETAVTMAVERERPRPRRVAMAVFLTLLALALTATGAFVVWPALQARARADARHFNNLGYRALASDSLESARDWFQRALRADGDYAPARLNLGLTQRRLNAPDAAAMQFAAVASRRDVTSEQRAQALYGLADLDLDAGAYANAVARLRQAAALDTTILVYRGNLVFALVRAGRYAEAITEGQKALSIYPGNPGLCKNLGYALVMSDRAAEAMPLLDRAVSVLDPPGPAYGVRALANAALGRKAPAAQDWDAFMASNPSPGERDAIEREYRARGGTP